MVSHRERLVLLSHDNGIQVDETTAKLFQHTVQHDPSDIERARELVEEPESYYLGLLYQNKEALRYDLYGAHNLGFTADQKIEAINREFDKYTI